MPIFNVNVKWGKEKFGGVELNTDEPPQVFKAQLFALSSVPPERQKVMLKGAVLQDDEWGNFKLKDGVTLMMMGSVGDIPTAPVRKTVFMEDMSEAQLASAFKLPAGLNNLGNTCYMNATVQCLRNVPELHDSLTNYSGNLGFGSDIGSPESVTVALRDLFKTMDKTSEAVPPIIFLQVLHKAFPQFSEKTEQGIFAQQDANECWTQMVRVLQQKLPGQPQACDGEEKMATPPRGFMDQYFGIESESTMKCVEAPDEPETKSKETLFQLSCFISQEVKYIHTGLQSRLTENITKKSPSLGRDAQYVKKSMLSRLPAYLTVQLVRFYFKEKEAVNAKILKLQKFKELYPIYQGFHQGCWDISLRADLKAKAKGPKSEEKLEPMEVDDKKKESKLEPYWFPDDVGSNNSGYYELTAVLTHQGRSSSSGHYLAWIKKKDDEWYKCDDDKITMVGDWHCAYVLLYAPRRLETVVETPAV
ncbi:predicted protein [Nematostella vectensis]|uniref:Ubiquitin carboxyl-terminal hydrolase n=1 Tax=Nematostella vectensis TaxID=45351 RepID=A7SFZ8_NEMVE|nr:predicted protein [Nematostella vectensis]|eukprot:XP_001629434.1 predicted protein [Nematostella vectensis]